MDWLRNDISCACSFVCLSATRALKKNIGFQIDLSLGIEAATYLEVGIGSGLLGGILIKNGKRFVGIDNNKGLGPDLMGVLPYLPFGANSFDVVMCFQVLEHIPVSMLKKSLTELARVSKIGVVLSLPEPDDNTGLKNRFAKRFFKIFHLPKRWSPRSVPIDSQHFWELGCGLEIGEFISLAGKAGMKLKTNFRNPYNYYHHFFLFVK